MREAMANGRNRGTAGKNSGFAKNKIISGEKRSKKATSGRAKNHAYLKTSSMR
jgi:hypothetical protein